MYGLSAADLEIQGRAHAFADELIPFEVEAEANDGGLPDAVEKAHHERALELGLYATNLPRSVGGQGCTILQQVLVQEQAGRVTNALGWCMDTPPSWWPEVANDVQRERWLLPTVRGEMSECYAITEEDAGSDVTEIRATARRDGDTYVLDGVKWHVTSFGSAAYVFFQAVLTTGDYAGQQALFVVDVDAPGVRVVRTPEYSHTIAHTHPIVAFEGVRVPADQLVGTEADGMSFVYEWFRFERLMVAARCLGAAQRLVDESTAFAKQRVVGGVPLSERQLVQAMLADSLTELFAARSMTYETARSVDEGVDVKVLHARSSMVKLYASELAGRVADRAVQIFGGRGYMRDNVAERLWREVRVERIWEGASEIQRLIIADQLAKRGASALV
ncbi:MAG TPA: acyl-CoA dehydrogenase family protein [Nocardioidaceae bacterium]|nr:acyl-CoA dehydrogenase family protein [Nocardioidaceae bacterium]